MQFISKAQADKAREAIRNMTQQERDEIRKSMDKLVSDIMAKNPNVRVIKP